MRWVLLVPILLSASAWAVQPRCGHDAFENIVCVDKDGVLSTQPSKTKRQEKSAPAKSGVNNAAEERSNRKSGNEVDTPAERCGTDPFGNTVCR